MCTVWANKLLTLHSQDGKGGHGHDISQLVDALLRNNGVGVLHNLINMYVCMHVQGFSPLIRNSLNTKCTVERVYICSFIIIILRTTTTRKLSKICSLVNFILWEKREGDEVELRGRARDSAASVNETHPRSSQERDGVS